MNAMAQLPTDANPVISVIEIPTLAVRMADEGVPVGAIARALKTPSDDIYLYLTEAKEAGQIVSIPKHDWPPQQTRDNRSLVVPAVFADEDILKFRIARTFKATKIESVLFASLLRRDQLTRQQLHAVVEQNRSAPGKEETDIKMIDVIICKLRKKIRDHGLVIETIWGQGYMIPVESRKIAAEMLSYV